MEDKQQQQQQQQQDDMAVQPRRGSRLVESPLTKETRINMTQTKMNHHHPIEECSLHNKIDLLLYLNNLQVLFHMVSPFFSNIVWIIFGLFQRLIQWLQKKIWRK
jgi:hypothetical protein